MPLREVPRGTRRHDDNEREQRVRGGSTHLRRMESERSPELLERRRRVRVDGRRCLQRELPEGKDARE